MRNLNGLIELNTQIVQYCDKEMDYEAVEKKWESQLSKNLANLQGNFRNKRIQCFLFEKNWINIIEDSDSQFYSWSRLF